MRKKFITFVILLFPHIVLANDVQWRYLDSSYTFTYVYPNQCEEIVDIYKNKNKKALNRSAYLDSKRKCKFYLAGNGISESADNVKKSISDTVDNAYEESGLKAFFKGLKD